MFQGFGDDLIPFFLDLRFHNDKAFMDANRERYAASVRQPFCAFIDAMGEKMQTIDPQIEIRPNKCLSRINRDTRFSNDKSPYRDHLWVSFRRAGAEKDGQVFYWFEISPEHVAWGLGLWGENRAAMDAMRRRMAARPDDFLPLLPILKKNRICMEGKPWKKIKVPENIPPELSPWYVKREIYFEKQGTDISWIYSPDIVTRVFKDYKALKPFYLVLRGCVEEALNEGEEPPGT